MELFLCMSLILWLISINGEGKATDTKQTFIVDMLQFQQNNFFQSHVSIYLCSNFATSYKMIRNFSEIYIALSVHMRATEVVKQLYAIYDDSRITFVLDMLCSDSATILQEADKLNMFNSRYKWILLGGCSTELNELSHNMSDLIKSHFVNESREAAQDDVEDQINLTPKTMNMHTCKQVKSNIPGLNFFINSDVTIAEQVTTRRIKLFQIYRIADYQQIFKNNYGDWSQDYGLYVNKLRLLTSGRMNLHKSPLKGTMVLTNNNSMCHLNDIADRHIDSLTKVAHVLYKHIVDILNASIEIKVTNSWGRAVNGTWNGMCGFIQRGDADLGITPMFITKDRLHFIHYLHPATETSVQFIFRQPPLSFVENIFTLPFSRAVWIGSTAMIGFIGFLLYHALKWETQIQQETDEKKMQIVTWSDMLLMAVGAVCQQGIFIEGKRIPGRIIVLLLFVIVIFLYTSYSAYVVALLQSTTTSIRSLSDLLQSGLTLAAHDIIYNHQYIKGVTDPVRQAIYTQRISPHGGPEHFYTMAEGLDLVRKGLFAFHMELGAGYKIISDTFTEDEKCNLQTMKFLIEIPDPWIAINKISPYKEILAVGYRMVHERGFQYRENHRYYYWKPDCSRKGTNFVSVGIIDCYSALLILLFGILAAVAILLMEIIVHRKLNRKVNIQT